MASATYFVQECPTCGRNLQVRVEYLGKRVVCQHCCAKFQATDPLTVDFSDLDSGGSMLARADELIEEATRSTLNARRKSAV